MSAGSPLDGTELLETNAATISAVMSSVFDGGMKKTSQIGLNPTLTLAQHIRRGPERYLYGLFDFISPCGATPARRGCPCGGATPRLVAGRPPSRAGMPRGCLGALSR